MNFLRKQLLMFVKEKHFLIMRYIVVTLLLILTSFQTFPQSIQREILNESGLGGKKMYAKIRSNIFNDYPWIEPDFQAKMITFSNHLFYFELYGLSFQLTQVDSNLIELKGSGSSMLIEKTRSKNDIYYGKNILKRKAAIKQKWMPHISVEKKVFPVKHLTPKSRNEYYTAFETHYSPSTSWKWENVNDSELTIPSYSYFQFDLNDGRTLFVYEVKNKAGAVEYFLQNASYLYASDADGIEYIMMDIDCNGSYTDLCDKFYFKSWNPYQAKSKYKKISFAIENTWYDYSFFQNYFLIPYFHDGKIIFENISQNYADANKKGILQLKKVPKNAYLLINKKEYPVKKGKNKYDCDYGIYKTTITCKNYADFEEIFTINDNNPVEEITHPEISSAGTFLINNIFISDFYISIKSTSGLIKNYHNTCQYNLPLGNYEAEIYFEGNKIIHQFLITKNETTEFDFEEELKKLTK